MKSRIYHIVFWSFYVFYSNILFYISFRDTFHFPVSIIHETLNIIYGCIVPFYAFAYFLSLFLDRKKIVKGILFFVTFLSLHFLFTYPLYPPLWNWIFGSAPKIGIRLMATRYVIATVNYFIFGAGYYFLKMVRDTEEKLFVSQKEKMKEEEKRLNAEVAFLKAQINPHFLHNILNYFYAQALPLSDKLAQGILSLSDIMRYALESNTEKDGFVWVHKEIEFVKKVIAINNMRFNGSIFINFSINGDDLTSLKIIPLTLITLVENALKHGELRKPEYPVEISVNYSDREQIFSFSVFNYKKKGPVEISHGIGLDNIINRLQLLYKGNASLTLKDEQNTYYSVIEIKY